MTTSKKLKKDIIRISYEKKLSHIGSCLTAVDIIDYIFSIKKPDDIFVLSSGHAGLAYYVVLEKYGGRSAEEIFEHHGVHPDRCKECGITVSTGSLGHGLGIAVGLALADRTTDIYCLISDGECSEGSIHEALRIKDEQKLDNLKVWVNFNFWGAYKKINKLYLAPEGIEKIKVERGARSSKLFPFLKDQEAHYKIMSDSDYKQALKILDA